MSRNEVEWQNGICDCFNDCSLCVITYFCPCYTFGKTAEALGENCCLCGFAYMTMFHSVARLHIRERIRQKKDVKGTYAYDYFLTEFCCFCTLVQEAQEVKDLKGEVMSRE